MAKLTSTDIYGSLYVQGVTALDSTLSATQLTSTIADGTAPLIVASSALVTNLNADLLDGQHASHYAKDSGVVHIAGAETITGIKTFSSTITGSITGNAGTVTNGLYSTGSYTNPAWITSLAASKLTGTIPSAVLGNSTVYIGTTPVSLNRSSATLALTGVTNTNWDTAYTDTNNATNANTASRIVKRDISGNFSAGIITANLTGTASGNLTSASSLNPANVSQTASYRFVTDGEKTTWNNKQNSIGYTPENSANKRTSIRTSGADNTSYVSELGVRTYVDGLIGSVYRPSGDWNASTNSPTLANNTPANAGKVYRVSTAGTQFGFTFAVGDKLAFNESGVISKWDNVDDVVSVNDQTGKVVLTTDNITQGSNLYVSQSEKTTWNNKQNSIGYTPENSANKRTSIRTSGADNTSYVSELGVKTYVDGVTATKQATITGAATTITSSNLTADRALISNGSGKVVVSAVTSTEIGFLSGVESSIQTQINGKAASTHTHSIAQVTGLQGALDGKAASAHNHDASNITSGTISDSRLPSTFVNLTDGKSNLPYKSSITIYGDSDKYYPVHFAKGDQNLLRTIKIWRSYNLQAPPDWNTPTHMGSLNLEWKGNYGGWGGAAYRQWIYENSSQYTTLLAKTQLVDNSYAMAFFLRGGGTTGALYHFASDQPLTWTDGYLTYTEPTAFYNQDLTFNNPDHARYAPAPRTTVNVSQLDSITVVKGGDARLTNSRPASDVSAWAKKSSLAIGDIPTGTTGSTVALGNHTHSQYLTSFTESDTLATVTARGNTTKNNLILDAGDEDRYIHFNYTGSGGYGWRLAYLGSGSGNANYFTIQTETETVNNWQEVLRFGLNDKIGVFAVTPKVGSNNVIIEGDSRLTNARPASDVYSWAKAANKPSYALGDISNVTLSSPANGQVLKYNGSAWVNSSDSNTDTKNTAGSTNTSSKIFLVGATSQAANPQTYSDDEVYVTSGVLTTKEVQVGGTATTMKYNSTTESIEFIFN